MDLIGKGKPVSHDRPANQKFSCSKSAMRLAQVRFLFSKLLIDSAIPII